MQRPTKRYLLADTSDQPLEAENRGEEENRQGRAGDGDRSSGTGSSPPVRSSRSSSISQATAKAAALSEAAASGSETRAADKDLEDDATGTMNPDATAPPAERNENTTKGPVSWWLEIVGADEVYTAQFVPVRNALCVS